MNSNNNSVGNLIDSYWNDNQKSPDTSENFAMKIENFNKKEKPKQKLVKEKSTKITKTIINIPNANFKNLIPKPHTQDKDKGKLINTKLPGDRINVPPQKANNPTTDLEDDTNEGIPIENNNLINNAFKSVNINNNNLNDINSKNIRLNTEYNNQNIYNNFEISPVNNKNLNMSFGNFNNLNSKINIFLNNLIYKIRLLL